MAASTAWIARQNITAFREKLSAETDEDKRRVLTDLLAKEQLKLAAIAAE